jgi:hypothetical protein
MPVKAGIHLFFGGVRIAWRWIPAFAGMTWVILAPIKPISPRPYWMAPLPPFPPPPLLLSRIPPLRTIGGMIGRGFGLTPGGLPGLSFSPPLGTAEMPAPPAEPIRAGWQSRALEYSVVSLLQLMLLPTAQ